MTSTDIYQEDLAKVHIDGYAFHWEGAASAVLRFLRASGVENGTVIASSTTYSIRYNGPITLLRMTTASASRGPSVGWHRHCRR